MPIKAQDKKIQGVVVTIDHHPVQDAEIYIKNSTILLSKSDMEGKIAFQVNDTVNTIEVRHALFETIELTISGANNFEVVLTKMASDAIFNLSLDDLASMKVSVASVSKDIQIDAAPGIVTVITQDEIEKSGSRDLVDVLRMVPGFFPENDVSGIFGLGIRGNWANEGKVLVLLDGVELNDDLYASVSYGHRFPVDLIERVEVIRGPGSAMYGGAAGFGVISIKTKIAEHKQDVFTSINYGATSNLTSRRNINLMYGGKLNEGSYTLSGHIGNGVLSDQDAQDLWGNTYNLGKDNTTAKQQLYINGNLKLKGADIRFIADKHKSYFPYPSLGLSNYETYFNNYFFEASYKFDLNKNLSITPRALAKRHNPWHTPELINDDGDVDSTYYLNLLSKKYVASVTSSYDYKDILNLFGGIDIEQVFGEDIDRIGSLGDEDEMYYRNLALYLQALLFTKYGNITLGGRYHSNSYYGSYFVPRLAYTKLWDRVHIKALLSQAVREPRMRNIAVNPDIKPEETSTIELEVGGKISKNWQLSANVFDVKLSNAIVFAFISDVINYGNYGNSHTRGLELASAYQSKKSLFRLSYSYYQVISNDIDNYKILNDSNNAVVEENQNLGFPSHKIYGLYSYTFFEKLDVSTSLTYLGMRYGVTSQNPQTNFYTYTKLDPYLLLSLNFTYKNLFAEGLNISFGVHNAFNQKYSYVQPYLGGEAPIPASRAEYVLKLSYQL